MSDPDIVISVVIDNDNPCTDSPCHENATCTVSSANVSCDCIHPYMGDGYVCQLQDQCYPSTCHQNATCILLVNSSSGSADSSIEMSGSSSGASGSGSSASGSGLNDKVSGSSSNLKPKNSGSCSGSGEGDQLAVCLCNSPYTGNGTHCDPPGPCEVTPPPCSANAECASIPGENGTEEANCTCLAGYMGSGQTCIREYCVHGNVCYFSFHLRALSTNSCGV